MNYFITLQSKIFQAIALTFALSSSLGAQSSLFTIVGVSPSELTASQFENYQRVLAQGSVVSAQFIEIGNLPDVQENGWLNLDLPDKECTARVKAKHVESTGNGDFYWHGEVISDIQIEEECKCFDGFLTLMRSGGELIGSAAVDGDYYEIMSIGGDKTLLARKETDGTALRCGQDEYERHTEASPAISTRSDENCTVRVLALFTANGGNAVPNIANTINMSIAQTNQTFRNSWITRSGIWLELVEARPIGFVETFDIFTDLESLIADPNVQALRNEANADIVVVYTDGNYGQVIGRAGTLTLDEARAICIVQATEALAEFNTAHEIGHLFACRHELESDPIGPFEHAHGFKTGIFPCRKDRNTVMFSVAAGNTIQHYSNPSVRFRGQDTGVADERDNARQLTGNACTVANFRGDEAIPPLLANITQGNMYQCPCSGVGLGASASGGAIGPYQFEWRTSDDGFDWSAVQSTSSNFGVTLPCEIGEGVYVWLRVASADGQIYDSYTYVETEECEWRPGGDAASLLSDEIGQAQGLEMGIKVYPNPVSDHLRLEWQQNIEGEARIRVIDVHGRTVYRALAIAEALGSVLEVPVRQLPDGMYFLIVNEEKSLRFVKKSNY